MQPLLARFPQKFGSYVLLERLGQGGMGEVYLAMSGHRDLETLCVVKRLLPALLSQADHVRRFRHEADLARRLVHSNLVHTHTIGEVGGEVFLVQEFVDGHDVSALLDEMAKQRRGLPVGVAVHVASQLARGLSYAHAFEKLNLVHRDINLPNVRLTYAGEVKLLDFGIASSDLHGETLGGQGAGKLWHQAPEQVRPGTPIDSRADVYALGVVLWELLTQRPIGTVIANGRELRQPETEGEVMVWITRGEHLPPSAFNREVPPALDALVGKAMRVLPADRHQSADELRTALSAFIPVGYAAEERLSALMNTLFSPDAERAARRKLIQSGRGLLDDDSGAAQSSPRSPPTTAASAQGLTRPERTSLMWLAPIVLGAMLGLAALLWLRRDSSPVGLPPEAAGLPAARTVEAALPPSAPLPAAVAAPPQPTMPARQPAKAEAIEQRFPPAAPRNDDALGELQAFPAKADHLSAARQAFNDREWARALSEGKKAVAAEGGAEAHAVVGNTLFKMGRFADAEAAFAKAVEAEPGNQLMQERLRLAHARAQDDLRREVHGEAP